jgi:hypothetical protein
MELLGNNNPGFRKSRRHFIIVTSLAAGCMALIRKAWPGLKPASKTTTFLTHDGKLVEVDLPSIPRKKRVVSKKQLVSWIWKDQKL